jgi:hypothetical protein
MLALNPKDTQGQGWIVPHDLHPFKAHSLIPVLGQEVGRLAGSLPLAIHNKKLVAICGTSQQYNLFISPKGEWMGNVKPLWLDTYPFFLYSVGNKAIPCFDKTSGWLTDDTQGEAFFNKDNELNPQAKQRVQNLIDNHTKSVKTEQAINALAQAKVLQPVSQNLISHYGIEHKGLLTLDERALAQLDDVSYLNLRQVGAIALGYAISFSLNQLHLLERLNRVNGEPKKTDEIDLDRFFGDDDDTFKF